MITVVDIWTDGACSGNPGPGGWATILQCLSSKGKTVSKMYSGPAKHTTNNRMELIAVYEGLNALRVPCTVTVHTDSAYIVDQINGGYLEKWKKNGWKTSQNTSVLNQDLWQLIDDECRRHKVTFVKTQGHADDALNNMADAEACRQRDIAKAFIPTDAHPIMMEERLS